MEGSVSRKPYDHDEGLRMLEFHGPTHVHERFEALAARHCHPGGSAGTVSAAMNEMLALGLKPRAAFYSAALAVSGPIVSCQGNPLVEGRLLISL